MSIDDDKDNPNITYTHNIRTVADTTTTSDKNTSVGTGINTGTSDTIQLFQPIVDTRGHIVGKNTETITLPYAFKTISFDAYDSSLVGNIDAGTESIIADSTKDTLTFASGNKWIHFTPDEDNDKITVSHEVNTITEVGDTTTVDFVL